jgi:hypothetical protein
MASKWENGGGGGVRLWVPGHTSHINQWEVSTNGLESLLSIVTCVNGDFTELSNRLGFKPMESWRDGCVGRLYLVVDT